MVKNLLRVFFLFCSVATALAQQAVAPPIGIATELSTAISGGKSQFVRTFDHRFADGTQGSPFLVDYWLPGTLILFDSTQTGDSLEFKFDTYLNEIWVLKNRQDSVILYSTYIRALELRAPDGRQWHFKKYQVDNSHSPVLFYQTIFEGRQFTLVKDERKLLVKANFVDRGVYTTGLPYDRFEGSTVDYFVQPAPGKPFVKIALKKRDFLALAPAARLKALEAFCKQEKIGKNLTEAEAAKILAFMERE